MNRRVVKETFEVTREANPPKKRQLQPGHVLNILQWIRPEIARFTVEGEGAEVWVCERETIESLTMP
jgi:hypothetical protein